MTARPSDKAVIRVLLRYREAVAQAVEEAYVDLHQLGVSDPEATLRGHPGWLDRAAPAEGPPNVIDLMGWLEQSVTRARAGKGLDPA